MLKYKQFFEGKTTRLNFSKTYYLKQYATSKNGKTGLFGFEIKDKKFQLWIPFKAIYNTLDNDIEISEDYKSMIIGHFIYDPEPDDRNYDEKKDFFSAYKEYMVPIIEKQRVKITQRKEQQLEDHFRDMINRMVPNVNVKSYDSSTKVLSTDIGDFHIYSERPITFKIGDVFLTLEEDGVRLNYKNQFTLKGLGKDGIVVKAMIKLNSGQKLNAVEIMALKRIYKQSLSSHDWYYDMSDDRRSYKSGSEAAKRISNLKRILTDAGEKDFADQLYTQYSPK